MTATTMVLRDNTIYSSNAENLESYLALRQIANKRISELLDEKGNSVLIYPHSFCQCEDDAGQQYLLSLRTNWEGNGCTNAVIETGNMVGFVGVNGHSISIHSRFAENKEEDFFLHYMLQKVLHINIVNLLHSTNNENVFDFLLLLFPKFLNEALSQGLYKQYQRNEYNDAKVRGPISISRHLKTNMPFNGRIAYRTREFSYDNNVTELIRHTIEYISNTQFGKMLLENDADTHTSVAQIIAATPTYSKLERAKIINCNSKTLRHPYYSRYTPLQKLCLRILKHEKVKYGRNEDEVCGVLFDVSYLWEEYLTVLLTQMGFSHPNNKKGTGRIYLANNNMLPRYPDFYRDNDKYIIDAKYKREISRDDVHQMITYMYRLKGMNGTFVQPSVKHKKECYDLLGYGAECNARLQTYSYPISQVSNDYNKFVEDMKLSENMFMAEFRV